MKNKEPEFPPPPKPLSFKKTVHKILDHHEYGEFLHRLILKARKGDQAAANLVRKYFEPLPTELDRLKLPRRLLEMNNVLDPLCTSNFMLVDFAAALHSR